jgi:hypothetical protein
VTAATYATVSAKLGKVQPATKSISQEIFDAAKKAGHEIWYMWGMGSSSEHATGRALDLMVRNEKAGDWIRNYIWTNRKRLRLQHVIWEQHITSTVTEPGVRRKMADRGSVTENHMDHIHVLFFAGAYQKPSPSSPSPSTPSKKTVDQIAHEIVEKGNWGNGPERVRKLIAAGYNPKQVQARVEEILNPPQGRKSIKTLAAEVFAGKWGNDPSRSRDLKEAGYDPKQVQAEVDRQARARR